VELKERVEAYEEKERKEWFRTAWMTAEIVSHLIGQRVEISDLLPEMFPAKVWTREEVKKELKEIKKELKIK
jgi:hypothetical protein